MSTRTYSRCISADAEPIAGTETGRESAAIGSRQLRLATERLFRTWEQTHGFQEGAAKILLPGGYSA